MSKHKSAKASKARSPKTAAKAHRAAQAIVRSPKSRPRLVAAGSRDSSPKRQNDSQPVAPIVKPVAPVAIEIPVMSSQESVKQTMTENSLSKPFVFSSATADLHAYQTLLLEMAQSNLAFALEFGQRLATTRSPFGLLNVIAEFAGRRIALIGKYSREMAELGQTRIA